MCVYVCVCVCVEMPTAKDPSGSKDIGFEKQIYENTPAPSPLKSSTPALRFELLLEEIYPPPLNTPHTTGMFSRVVLIDAA